MWFLLYSSLMLIPVWSLPALTLHRRLAEYIISLASHSDSLIIDPFDPSDKLLQRCKWKTEGVTFTEPGVCYIPRPPLPSSELRPHAAGSPPESRVRILSLVPPFIEKNTFDIMKTTIKHICSFNVRNKCQNCRTIGHWWTLDMLSATELLINSIQA